MTIETYSKPQGAPDSDWQVYAGIKPTWTHHTSRGATATVSTDGSPVVFLVVAPETLTSVDIVGQKPGQADPVEIPSVALGRWILFTVPKDFYGNVLIKTNDAEAPDWQKFCSIGVLPLETDIPTPDQVTHYFGPGVHTGDPIRLYSGETVYVAGGAYLNRRLLAGEFNGQRDQLTDIKVYGRGVIDTSNGYEPDDRGLGTFDIFGVNRFEMLGVTYVSRFSWAVAAYLCNQVYGQWLRLYSCEILDAPDYASQGTPDGWDFIGCTDVVLSCSLLSASDDSGAIKGDKYGAIGDTTNVLFQDVLLMQGGKSNGFDIGYENGEQTVSGVTYRRVVVAECWRDTEPYRTSPLSIHVPSKATVENVLYEDIHILSIKNKDHGLFIGTWYSDSLGYSHPGNENRGTIRDITFRRVHWPANPPKFRIASEAADKRIDVTFEDCTVGGEPLTEALDGWEIINADVEFVISDPEPEPEPDDLESRVEVLENVVSNLVLNQKFAAHYLEKAAKALNNI